MSRELRWKFLFIFVVSALAIYILLPLKNKPLFKHAGIVRGIDLQGGAELRYKVLADPDQDISKVTRDAINVISNRINLGGLKEPKITSYGDDEIIIQLAGVDADTVKRYKDLLKKIGHLELCEVGDERLHREYPIDGLRKPAGYRLVKNTTKAGDHEYIRKDKIWVKQEPICTGKYIENAYPSYDPVEGWIVNFILKGEGAKKFGEATERLVQKGYIAIILDKKLISRPFVRSVITDRGIISGGFESKEEVQELSVILRSGSLPAPVGRIVDGKHIPGEPEAEMSVGATLGQDSIRRGFIAAVIASLLVAFFMLICYRILGAIAIATLILNMIFILAIMSLFNATLTLPGIAGIILTIGMAVDANILIFERIREEQAKGRALLQCFEIGHERALTAIIDANLTTLIVALVLYYIGTGPVEGFAVTLSIGIICTLFTAVFCGKTFHRMLINAGIIKEYRMLQIFSRTNFNFINLVRGCIAVSLLLLVGGIIFFAYRGSENFGIDFRGGSLVTLEFASKQRIEDIREGIRKITVTDERGTTLPKYPDAEVQTMAPLEAGLESVAWSVTESTQFQIRTQNTNLSEIKRDLQEVFAKGIYREPFEDLPQHELPDNERDPFYNGTGMYVYLRNNPPIQTDKVIEAMRESVKDILENDPKGPIISIQPIEGPGEHMVKLKVLINENDKEAGKLTEVKDAFKGDPAIPLSRSPFTYAGSIGPAIAEELKETSVHAMIVAWVLIILYIALRFHGFGFGVAAVIAIIHDAIITIGIVSICGFLIPKAMGFNFEFSLSSVAAILAVIGYSVNDTIVIFDRIRENLILLKRETLRNIVNISINQNLSRTILTSLTTWVAVVTLYTVTLRASSGIETFAFPLIVGIIIGTYSSIYVASPLLLYWYRKGKPQVAG